MPTLSTQSIGAAGAPIANAPVAAQAARASQTAVVAGVQNTLNQQRANESATVNKIGKRRSIQDETRTEGVFGEEAQEDKEKGESPPGRGSSSGFTRVA
jgi:hypothetical protein